MADTVPPRLLWAVERLSVEPDDHLLEIGCGSGAAVSLISDPDLELPAGSFTKIFAANVNLFWVRSPATELEVARRLLAPGGGLFLFYDAPSESKLETTAERLVATLAEVGLPAANVEKGRAGSSPILGVVVRP